MGGFKDGPKAKAQFDEPGGIDVAEDGTVYLADTNNHAVRVIDPESGEVSTFVLKGLNKVMPFMDSQPSDNDTPDAIVLDSRDVSVGEHEIVLDLQFPDGFKLNPDGGLNVTVSSGNGIESLFTTSLPLTVPVRVTSDTDTISLDLRFVYCREDNEGLCYFDDRVLKLPLRVNGSIPDAAPVHVSYSVGHSE